MFTVSLIFQLSKEDGKNKLTPLKNIPFVSDSTPQFGETPLLSESDFHIVIEFKINFQACTSWNIIIIKSL